MRQSSFHCQKRQRIPIAVRPSRKSVRDNGRMLLAESIASALRSLPEGGADLELRGNPANASNIAPSNHMERSNSATGKATGALKLVAPSTPNLSDTVRSCASPSATLDGLLLSRFSSPSSPSYPCQISPDALSIILACISSAFTIFSWSCALAFSALPSLSSKVCHMSSRVPASCSHLNRKNEKSSALEMIPLPATSITANSA
mmetsp:Transcript_11382/g.26331  ORF Transcript_11382/g.26331 Transcript_11382/m.26331 type:complete len:204 (-) Transcript_11382:1229-1840(-)